MVVAGVLALTVSCSQDPRPLSLSGTIETDEVHVASRYGGRVEKILAWAGDVPTNRQAIGSCLPTTYLIELMHAIILRGASLREFWFQLAVLSGMGAVLFARCALRFKQKIA